LFPKIALRARQFLSTAFAVGMRARLLSNVGVRARRHARPNSTLAQDMMSADSHFECRTASPAEFLVARSASFIHSHAQGCQRNPSARQKYMLLVLNGSEALFETVAGLSLDCKSDFFVFDCDQIFEGRTNAKSLSF
jgi:hypothetical protein